MLGMAKLASAGSAWTEQANHLRVSRTSGCLNYGIRLAMAGIFFGSVTTKLRCADEASAFSAWSTWRGQEPTSKHFLPRCFLCWSVIEAAIVAPSLLQHRKKNPTTFRQRSRFRKRSVARGSTLCFCRILAESQEQSVNGRYFETSRTTSQHSLVKYTVESCGALRQNCIAPLFLPQGGDSLLYTNVATSRATYWKIKYCMLVTLPGIPI